MRPNKTPGPWIAAFALVLNVAGITGMPSAKANTHVNVITVTDTTAAGKALAPASPEHPVYYVAEDLGFREFGSPVPGDPLPPHKYITTVIVRTLEKQGYLPADKVHPPTQLIIFNWGTMYDPPSLGQLDGGDELYEHTMGGGIDIGGHQANGSDQPSTVMLDNNDHSLKHPPNPAFLKFMGGDKLDLMWDTPNGNPRIEFGFDARVLLLGMRGKTAEKVHDAAEGDLYVAALGGYDFKALLKGKDVQLWQTRIACPSDGLALAETLPRMIVAAGPQIGRDTPLPVWNDAVEEDHQGQVNLGEIRVVGTIEPDAPVIDATKVDRKGAEDTP
jgi:hypothetical protein